MIEFMLEAWRSRHSAIILEPRGHAKTTWGNTILLTWLTAIEPDIRVGLISNTDRQSYNFSRAIRWTYERNPKFRDVFGDIVGKSKWTDAEWLRDGSAQHGTKDVTMYATGAGGAVISKRFDLIICDDILDEENTRTIEQQEKVETWFWKTLKPCLTPDGVILVLGTRWAEGDLYEKLLTSDEEGGKAWPSLVRGAIYKNAEDQDTALWPAVWPLDRLFRERLDMGSALFACSYLNDISGLMAGNVFRSEWFQYFDELPADHTYTVRMGVDLASSEKEHADYTARATVAEDEDGNFYVLSVYRDRRETNHSDFVLDGFRAHPEMALVVIENQQFQSTLIKQLMVDYPRIPVIGKKSDVDKVTRARAVASRYEAGKVFHRRSYRGTEFEGELLSFPRAHDDMVDALGFAMDLGGGGFYFGSVPRG